MYVINARNVNFALYLGGRLLKEIGEAAESRNGPVVRSPDPVTTVFNEPMERVMLVPERDANPFFHLVEALWMVAGRNDLKPLLSYVKRMTDYSDDGGKTQPGAYGYRWRQHFARDQLLWAVQRLRKDPDDRRVVISMYDPNTDQPAADNGGRDVPCNISMLPWVYRGRLNLTVYNRSHDMVWGAYGANAVHFSVVQELLAAMVGARVGKLVMVSNNFHAYERTAHQIPDQWPWGDGADEGLMLDPYTIGSIDPWPIFSPAQDLDQFTDDVSMFFMDPARVGIRNGFIRKVACPMVMAHRAYREAGAETAREILGQIHHHSDWRRGAEIWISNREFARRRRRAADDGVNYEHS